MFLSQSTKENIDLSLLVEDLWYTVETLDFSPFADVKLIGYFSAVSVFTADTAVTSEEDNYT